MWRWADKLSKIASRKAAQKKHKKAKERFNHARLAVKSYNRRLRSVGRYVGQIVKGYAPDGVVEDMPGLSQSLQRYADLLRPWATKVASAMIADINQRDKQAWQRSANEIGVTLRTEINHAPTGLAMKQKLAEQVDLIQSIPLDAAQRVHRLAIEALSSGARAKEIADDIKRSGTVSESRAMTIARTETGRTATALTEARALYIGSETYTWRTAGDADVRHDHKILNGKVFRWDDPPIADRRTGARAHPGSIYNCRCYAEPNIPDPE